MKTFPLVSLTLEQAQQKQFALVDIISQHFTGSEFLNGGDLGLNPTFNQPRTTRSVEKVIAQFFHAQQALLVQGAGTGAIREGLAAMIKTGGTLLVHDAPIYPTTKITIEQMGLTPIYADFNQPNTVKNAILQYKPDVILIQHTRQQPEDHYALQEVIECARHFSLPSLIDDNYAVLKVPQIGCEMQATLSTFSSFKLLGPVGVGVIVGDAAVISKIRQTHYSGGCQIQGFQALEVLRGLVFAPVMHAIQSAVNEQLCQKLNQGELHFVKHAFIANAQSKVLLVEFHDAIANELLIEAERLGALPYPVGAESKYEILPLFYRVSGTFRKADPTLEQRMIRINPNRAGTETIIRLLQQSYDNLTKRSA